VSEITYVDRETKEEKVEKVYGNGYLIFLYQSNPLSWLLRALFCKPPFFSKLYGSLQKKPSSKKKIAPFIENYQVDTSEFLDPPDSFPTFNDFFIRKLKPSARPIHNGNDEAVLPADGRYLVFDNIEREEGFLVKGKKFNLETLLRNPKLAHKYAQGSMVMARLAPVDYHRFHFPCHCTPSETTPINGPLYSVNPIALRKNIQILAENKRVITHLKTEHFGTVLFIEIGATFVGSIHQTYAPDTPQAKGAEKGYFSFGGSCLILLFEPFRIQFTPDLLAASHKKLETLGQMGQSLGRALSP